MNVSGLSEKLPRHPRGTFNNNIQLELMRIYYEVRQMLDIKLSVATNDLEANNV